MESKDNKLTRPASFAKPVVIPQDSAVNDTIGAAKVQRTANAGLAYQSSGAGRKKAKTQFTCYIPEELVQAIKYLAHIDTRSESYVVGMQLEPLLKAARDLGLTDNWKPPSK
jgi:hypothetical protein